MPDSSNSNIDIISKFFNYFFKPLKRSLFNSIKNDDYNKKKRELDNFNKLYRNPFQSLRKLYSYLPNEDGKCKDHNDKVKELHKIIDNLYEHKSAIDKIDENEKEFLNSRLKMIGSFVLFIFGTVLMADPKYNLFGLAVASGPLVTLFATIPFLAPLIATGYFLYNQDNIAKKNKLELEKITTQGSDVPSSSDDQEADKGAKKNTFEAISQLISEIEQHKVEYRSNQEERRRGGGVHLSSASRLQGGGQIAQSDMAEGDGAGGRTVDGAGGAIPRGGRRR